MANISLIYDGIITLVEAQLSTYSRLADAYNVESNDILRLVKGYSVGFGPGNNTERYITDGMLTTEHTFTLTLTNLFTANDADPSGRATIEKSLMEDAYKIWKKLQTTNYFGSIQVANCKYINDNGIEYTFGDNHKAISVISTLSVEYFE